MKLGHITYQLTNEALHRDELAEFMNTLGFQEIEPDDPFEHGYDVRWFRHRMSVPDIHCVALGKGETEVVGQYRVGDVAIHPGLGHFCLHQGAQLSRARQSPFCVRDSGSGRVWMEYADGAIRVEVRR